MYIDTNGNKVLEPSDENYKQCVVCGMVLQDDLFIIPVDENPYCPGCVAAHNAAIDEVLALVKKETFVTYTMYPINLTGHKLYDAIEKMKFPEDKNDSLKENNDDLNAKSTNR